MNVEVVVVAVDLADADRFAAEHLGDRSWRACTMRSPDRVRGVTAGYIALTPAAIGDPRLATALMVARPCTVASGR